MSHTPAPWRVLSDDWKYQFIKAGDKTIAEVTLFGDSSPHDARLIAAAPDLLATLEHIVERITNCVRDLPPSVKHLAEDGLAAIRKAKGEA